MLCYEWVFGLDFTRLKQKKNSSYAENQERLLRNSLLCRYLSREQQVDDTLRFDDCQYVMFYSPTTDCTAKGTESIQVDSIWILKIAIQVTHWGQSVISSNYKGKITPTWPDTSMLQERLWKSVHNSLCEATNTKLQQQGEANKQFKSWIQTVKLARQDTNWEEQARWQRHLKTRFAI